MRRPGAFGVDVVGRGGTSHPRKKGDEPLSRARGLTSYHVLPRPTAHRSPAGFYPVNVLAPWVTMAGSGLHCSHCDATGTAPLPRAPGYGAAVEAFLAQHRACADREEARP